MDSKKPQSLGIAYDVKRRSSKKKMAEGGKVREDRDKMSGKSGLIRTDTESNQNQKGVHQHGSKGSSGGISEAGGKLRDYGSQPDKQKSSYGKKESSHVKEIHKDTLSELKSMPKPKLEGMAEGGEVQKPRLQPKKHPMMVKSDAFSAKLRDDEDDNSINHALSIEDADQDMEQEPQGLEEDDDQMKPSDSEIMSDMMAEGGMMEDEVRPDRGFGKVIIKNAKGGMIDDEMDMDHEDSIAAAIMARKDRMMAEGGQVDIDSNNEEQPNGYYEQNEDAVLKENYDKDMDDMSQPMDSNEHGHNLSDEDAHDMVSKIRSVMNKNRQFKVR